MLKNSPSSPCNWSFRRFWCFCADELGSARLQVDAKAADIEQFCGNSQFALTSIKQVLVTSYKRSRCKNLDSRINLNATLDVLGEAAYALQGQHKDDLLDIELLEEIGWCVNAIYPKEPATTEDSVDGITLNSTLVHASQRLYLSERSMAGARGLPRRKRPSRNTRVVCLASAKQRRANSVG